MTKSKSCNRRSFLQVGAGMAVGGAMARYLPLSGEAAVAEPTKPLRPFGLLLDCLPVSAGMRSWKLDRWKREIADIKRMGARTIWIRPTAFGERSLKDYEPGNAWWQLVVQGICPAIAAAGLELGIHVSVNRIPTETWKENRQWRANAVAADGVPRYTVEEGEVCFSIPDARREVLSLHEKLYAALPKVEYLMVQAADPGGCACQKCMPWAKTYLKLHEETTHLCKRHHPNVQATAGALNLGYDEMEMLRGDLRAASWVDYVIDSPRGPKPVIKVAFAPETNIFNQYGKFGACPVLAKIKHGYEVERPNIAGVAQYSEGIHDDVNRFAVLQFAENPQRFSADQVARAYAEEWLGLKGDDARLAAEVIAGLGSDIVFDRQYLWEGADNPHADQRVKISADLRARSPGLADNYRYWLLHYRTVCESFATAVKGSLSLDELRWEALGTRLALIRLEPEFGRYLSAQASTWHPEFVPWAWPRAFNATWERERRFAKEG